MGKRRSLSNQANHVVSNSLKIGKSKRNDQLNKVDTTSNIYSNKTASKMRDFAHDFSKFLKENTNIRYLAEIKDSHIKAYFKSKEKNWNIITAREKESQMKKFLKMTNETYHTKLTMPKLDLERHSDKKIRDKAMNEEDYKKLDKIFSESNSKAKDIPFIIHSIGARAEEAASIRPEHISIERREVLLVNTKGKKIRRVSIPKEDLNRFKTIKRNAIENGYGTVAGDMKVKSIQNAVRNKMKAIGIDKDYPNTSCHAIRKNFATRNYNDLLAKGLDSKRAWSLVQVKLGHSSRFRRALFETYINK